MIDLYCERLGPEFWSEPVNALTNAAFLISGYLIFRLADKQQPAYIPALLLAAISIAIGIGSFVFHTLATATSRWLDIIPILLFQLTFIWFYTTKLIDISKIKATVLLILYLAVALYCRQFPQILNGSLIYAPALSIMLCIAIWHYSRSLPHRTILFWGCGIFALSITCRTIDSQVCDALPLGTHFLWHLFNGVVVYLCAQALVGSINRCKEIGLTDTA